MSNKNNNNSNNSLPPSFTQFRSPQQSQQMQFDPFAPAQQQQQQQTQQVQQQQQQQQQLLQQLQQQVAQQQQLLQLQTLQLQQLQQVQGAPTQQQQTPQIQGAPPSSYAFPQPPQPPQLPHPFSFRGSSPFPPPTQLPTQMPSPYSFNSNISTIPQRGTLQRPIRAAPDVGFNGLYLHLILDESGSMDSVRDLTIKNFNSYIKTQQDQRIVPEGAEGVPSSSSSSSTSTETEAKSTDNIQGDKVSVSLTKFDAPQIIDVYKNTPLAEVPLLSRETYKPNGGTNMLDAVGVVIQQIDDILLAQAETEQRPAVLVVIMTDGHENQSHSFTMETIKAMITARQEKGWTFVFMGANIDAWGAAAQVGISQNNAFNFSVRSEDALQSLSSATAQYRAFNSCQQAQAQQSPQPSSERMQQYQQAQQSYAFFSPQVRAQYESPAQKF